MAALSSIVLKHRKKQPKSSKVAPLFSPEKHTPEYPLEKDVWQLCPEEIPRGNNRPLHSSRGNKVAPEEATENSVVFSERRSTALNTTAKDGRPRLKPLRRTSVDRSQKTPQVLPWWVDPDDEAFLPGIYERAPLGHSRSSGTRPPAWSSHPAESLLHPAEKHKSGAQRPYEPEAPIKAHCSIGRRSTGHALLDQPLLAEVHSSNIYVETTKAEPARQSSVLSFSVNAPYQITYHQDQYWPEVDEDEDEDDGVVNDDDEEDTDEVPVGVLKNETPEKKNQGSFRPVPPVTSAPGVSSTVLMPPHSQDEKRSHSGTHNFEGTYWPDMDSVCEDELDGRSVSNGDDIDFGHSVSPILRTKSRQGPTIPLPAAGLSAGNAKIAVDRSNQDSLNSSSCSEYSASSVQGGSVAASGKSLFWIGLAEDGGLCWHKRPETCTLSHRFWTDAAEEQERGQGPSDEDESGGGSDLSDKRSTGTFEESTCGV